MNLKAFVLIAAILLALTCHLQANGEDLYELLGISRKATTREIRQAFKKLALEKHPDKNTGDPHANEVFMKINRAYEILKDEELRKKYDQFGEQGLKDDFRSGSNYQSWNFYNQNFGIYDEDAEIITLSRSDFMQLVEGSEDIWFINFYSTQCSHCHELAPTWREVAKQLEGVVRIGAVNCMDDFSLCNENQIRAYPSLLIYPKREFFQGQRTTEELVKYALSFAKSTIHELKRDEDLKARKEGDSKRWFFSFCELNEDDECMDEIVLKKLAIMLNGLVNVAKVNCHISPSICKKLKPQGVNMFYNDLKANRSEQKRIDKFSYKEIAQDLLQYLPDVQLLENEAFQNALTSLRESKLKAWLIQFVSSASNANNNDLDLRKVPFLLDDINFGRIDCSDESMKMECERYQIVKYPTFVLFKQNDLHEIHYGRTGAQDLAAFAKENALTNVKSLSESDFPAIIQSDKGAIIDFFAPWCPPCMNLLPQFRKASQSSGHLVNFGTVDCTVNARLCEQFGIRSYPSTILFNKTVPNRFHGGHRAEDINEFIKDVLNPTVQTLTYDSFYELVGKKPVGTMWLVDFYASWCGPCQQLSPEWRKLAKKLTDVAFVGQVDCVIEQRLCMEQGINSYPNIRLYPPSSAGISTFQTYPNHMWRDVNTMHQWASSFLPSKAVVLDGDSFENLVLKSSEPWLVDFYAPWCGHCQVFMPTFEAIATKMEGKVKCGKLDCQQHGMTCQRAGIRAYPTVRVYEGKAKTWFGQDIHSQDQNVIINTLNIMLASHDEL